MTVRSLSPCIILLHYGSGHPLVEMFLNVSQTRGHLNTKGICLGLMEGKHLAPGTQRGCSHHSLLPQTFLCSGLNHFVKPPPQTFLFLLSTTNASNIFCSWCFLEQQSDRQTLDQFPRAVFSGCRVSGYRRCRQVGNEHTLSWLIPFVPWLKVNLHMCFGWIVFVETI